MVLFSYQEESGKDGLLMPRKMPGRRTVSVTLTEGEYNELKRIAAKEDRSMSEVGRMFITQGLNGTLTKDNLDDIAPVIREQVDSVLSPKLERLISLAAKTCIQSGAAAYLSADAIFKFVPAVQREEVNVSYEEARKKAVVYMKGKPE